MSTIQLLPKDENGRIQGVARWNSRDTAWTQCLRELKKLVDEIQVTFQKGQEAAEVARKDEEFKQQQRAEAEKNERQRHRRDEAFWKKATETSLKTTAIPEKITLLEDYLQDAAHLNHRSEAEEQIEELQAELIVSQKVKETRTRHEAERWQKEQEAVRKIVEKQEVEHHLKVEQEATLVTPKSNKKREKGYPIWYLYVAVRSKGEVMIMKEQNPFIMSGNVWEWCQDAWHPNYEGAPSNGNAWQIGGSKGTRVIRGGSWNYLDKGCCVANRLNCGPLVRYVSIGFRVVSRR